MSVSELCQICESRPAERTCERCGRTVCSQHFDSAFSLCMDCSEGAGSGPDEPAGPGREDAGENVRF
jgi:hypothetical protein